MTPVSDAVARSSRAAAERLSSEFGDELVAEVEATLQAGEAVPIPRPDQYFDPISLGALIVSVATLAWTIYTDLRSTASNPGNDLVERRIRVALRTSQTPVPEHEDLIVGVVVSELIRAAEEDH